MTWNAAPCGSCSTANVPTGIACGGTSTVAPSSLALAAVAAQSGTPK